MIHVYSDLIPMSLFQFWVFVTKSNESIALKMSSNIEHRLKSIDVKEIFNQTRATLYVNILVSIKSVYIEIAYQINIAVSQKLK